MRLITLDGTPYEMGRQHGELLREEIHALAEERLRLSLRDVPGASREEALALAGRCLEAHREYAPAVGEEFQGIAEGADISLERLLIGNGYTDFKDVLAKERLETTSNPGSAPPNPGSAPLNPVAHGCSTFLVRREGSASGRTLVGQTWDMHGTAEPFVVAFHRRPRNGPETLTVTTAGCLSLIGVNEHGLAIGNSNLVPTDARPGVIYLALIHHVLAQRTLAEAQRAILDAPRASGHNYYLADGGGNLCDIETTATQYALLIPEGPTYAHTNHYHAPSLQALAAPVEASASTFAREKRLAARLAEKAGQLDPPAIQECLADHSDGPNSVCVHGSGGDAGKTCAVAILCPDTRDLWAKAGLPCEGKLVRFSLGN